MKHLQQAETPLSQHSNSAPFSRPQRSLLSIALCSAGLLGAIAAIPSAYAVPMVGLTDVVAGAQQILTFDSATPGTTTPSANITGLSPGEIIVTIDFRPSDTLLYGISDQGNIYTIVPGTGVAMLARANGGLILTGTSFFGLDFNPTNDALRLTSNTAPSNRAITISDASSAGVDAQPDLAYAAGDPGAVAGVPAVEASAYTNSVTGTPPTTTVLYDIDTGRNFLVTQVPATGVLTSVGTSGLGVDAGNNTSFDIASDGTAYAAFVTGAGTTTNLYTIDLGTGAANLVGPIGAAGGPQVIGLSAVPSAGTAPAANTVAFTTATFAGTEGASTAVTLTRTGDPAASATAVVTTTGGTATAGSDFTALDPATTGLATFAPGSATATVNVAITQDTADEPSETINLGLGALSGGATPAAPTTAVLSIAASDTAAPAPPATNNDDDGGCTVNPNGKDAGLLALLLSAAFVGLRRRWKK